MKIMHIVPALALGGGERAAINLANEQNRRGHDVTIVSAVATATSPLRDAISNKIQVIDANSRGGRLGRYHSVAMWAWRNRNAILEFDVIHAHLTVASWLATLVFAFLRITGRSEPKVVETYHAVGMPISPTLRAFHYFMLGRRDGVVFMAEDAYSRRFAAAKGKPKIAVILNGEVSQPAPTSSQIDDYRRGSGIAGDKLIIGTVGRLVRERRPDIFIEIFAQLHLQNTGAVEFLFVGEGAARTEVEELSRAHGLEGNIHFPGVELDAIKPMSVMSVYLTLMVGNVSGMAGVQAALAGIPVVGFQLDPTHVRSNKDWIWSDPDPVQVAFEITRLLRNKSVRQSMANTQQRFARDQYSIHSTANSYEAFLENVRFPEKAVQECVG